MEEARQVSGACCSHTCKKALGSGDERAGVRFELGCTGHFRRHLSPMSVLLCVLQSFKTRGREEPDFMPMGFRAGGRT